MTVSFSIAFSGHWVVFQVDWLGSFLVNVVLSTQDFLIWVGGGMVMVSSRLRGSCDHQFFTPLLNFFGYPDGAVIRACEWHFTAPLFLHSFSPRNFHLGRYVISLVITRWLVPVQDQVFIFRVMILFSSVQRNVHVSQVRAQLSCSCFCGWSSNA